MVKDCGTVWDNCLRTIEGHINKQSFQTWFKPIKAVNLDNNALTIQVPNKFFYEWLEEHYVALLKMTIRKELGSGAKLEYQIPAETSNSTVPESSNSSKSISKDRGRISPGMLDTSHIKNPFVIPGIRKLNIDPQLNVNYTFGNLIEGDCNKLGRNAGLAIADRPGGTSFNPLFLFGDVGLGKTHLAQAIGNEILRQHKNKSVLYVSSEKFTNQIIQSIKNNAVNDFVNFYQSVDVLIIDDIQFLANKQKTQEIFFHIFNQLHQKSKQLILTSDRPPKNLEGMEERLISRFKWGLSADLQTPDLETRMAILEAKLQDESVEVPSEVIEFVAYNIKKNIRELEGVLVSLVAEAKLNQVSVDIDLAKKVIRNFINQENREITMDNIKTAVAESLQVPVEKLQAKTRKREFVVARQLAMYLVKSLTNHSLKNIGDAFGGRDHSTVIYSCKTVGDMMDVDESFKNTVNEIEKKLTLSMARA
ncbi:MAG: chromosomal replication initiator protein DnaA [Bacteroidia bacterium]|nr:chromosomal replication initiator protein DnaA [Bacteroidia bacterium]